MSKETKPRDKRKASSIKTLEAIIEILILEVAHNHPSSWRVDGDGHTATAEALKTWAHMTAMYVTECIKRKDSPPSTIIRNAKKAVKRRLERELADSYLQTDIPPFIDPAVPE